MSDGRVTLAERAELDRVMRELRLQSSGRVSDGSAKQLGQLLGVEAVLSGTYTDFGHHVRINARIIETQSGRVLAARSVTVRKTRTVAQLLMQDGGAEDELPSAPPVYKKWWFWTAIGAAVVGGTVGAVAATTGGNSQLATGADGRFNPVSFPNR